jgi:hypothetical protein
LLVGSSEAKKAPGLASSYGSPRRKTPKKRHKINREKIGFGFFVDFLQKLFDAIFL